MIPLPRGIQGSDDNPQWKESLTNLYFDNEQLIQRPGITQTGTITGSCRGAFSFDSSAYMVSGTDLLKVAEDGTSVNVGTVQGSGDIAAATDFARAVVIEKGGNAVELLQNGTVTPITTNYAISVDVEQIGGRFIFVPEDGSPPFYTDPNSVTIQANNFFDAEQFTDKNTGAVVLNNRLYIGGESSFEVFRLSTSDSIPFIKIDGAAVTTGYIGGKAFYDKTFAFLGRMRDSTPAFYFMGQGGTPKISNKATEDILKTYTLDELKATRSHRFAWNDREFIAWTLARHTFLFNGEDISLLTSADGSAWRVHGMTNVYGFYLVGDSSSNLIGKLDDVYTEYTAPIEYGFTTFLSVEKEAFIEPSAIELNCVTGTASQDNDRISCEVSKDQEVWFRPIWRGLGKIGERNRRVIWAGGVGQFESHMGMRFFTNANRKFTVRSLNVS